MFNQAAELRCKASEAAYSMATTLVLDRMTCQRKFRVLDGARHELDRTTKAGKHVDWQRAIGDEWLILQLGVFDCPMPLTGEALEGAIAGIVKRCGELDVIYFASPEGIAEKERQEAIAREFAEARAEEQRWRDAEAIGDDSARVAAIGPTFMQNDLLARGWTRSQIEALGVPDYVLCKRSYRRRWVEHHFAVPRVKRAERNRKARESRAKKKALASAS